MDFLNVIDNLVEKGVGILSKLATDWIDDLGKEVFGNDKSSSNQVVHPQVSNISTPAVGNPVNQVNVNVTINGLRPGLIFVDENGNDVISVNGYHIANITH